MIPRRLRSQLALVIAIALAPAGLVAIMQALSGAQEEIKQRTAAFASDSHVTALNIRETLRQARVALADIADAAEESFFATGNCDDALARIQRARPDLWRLALLDAKGHVVCGADDWNVARNLPKWQEFVANPEPLFTLKPGESKYDAWRVTVLHPTVFMRPEALALAAEMRSLEIGAPPPTNLDSRIYAIVDEDSTLLAETPADASGWMPSKPEILFGDLGLPITGTSREGQKRLYVSQRLFGEDLRLIASTPMTSLADVLTSAAGVTFAGPILLWLIAVIVAYVSIDKLVTRHIAYLGRAASRIGQGELDAEIRHLDSAPHEIRELGNTIRVMAGNLQDRDARMRDALDRQKSLVLEIHHRVKNNLQMVTSLINIQLRRVKSPGERNALRFLSDRVQSLALVHQHLYGNETPDSVSLEDLVRDICERLRSSMTPVGASVGFRYSLTPLIVESRTATPVALFLTEAVSNVFKHAVGQTGEHVIEVSLATDGPAFVLEISNSITHTPPPPAQGEQGLGMRLLRSFATQINGEYCKSADAGTFRLSLRAPLDAHSEDTCPADSVDAAGGQTGENGAGDARADMTNGAATGTS